MVSLNLERINSNSPYAVTALRDSMCFRFVTDFGVIYYVSFLEDELMLSDESYQFIIANTNNRKSPRDSKLRRLRILCLLSPVSQIYNRVVLEHSKNS